ncbi:hypothetical protein C8D90_101345 [Enterobacillus tribolii]|uniref:Uncharacterized protein n=1 Tax=Enterobacillus tribolii TaxID=1487935 RepID=A0A370R3B5_9GAMM|nr:hypothetical protein C8D90_101345 [Enterobacillus tribolii]
MKRTILLHTHLICNMNQFLHFFIIAIRHWASIIPYELFSKISFRKRPDLFLGLGELSLRENNITFIKSVVSEQSSILNLYIELLTFIIRDNETTVPKLYCCNFAEQAVDVIYG